MTEERQTFTVEQAARIMGIGRNSAYEAIRRGEIPVLRIGRRLLVPKKALEDMLSSGSRHEPEAVHNERSLIVRVHGKV